MKTSHDSVLPCFSKLFRTPEGWLYLVRSSSYLLAFICFESVVIYLQQHDVQISNDYRISFIFMPLLLLAAHIRFDISAKTTGDRLLTAIAILCLAAIPIFRILR